MGIKKVIFVSIAAAAALGLVSCGGSKSAATQSTESQAQTQQPRGQTKGKAVQQNEGPRTVADPAGELNGIRINLMGLNIPCGIGVGKADSEQEALKLATEDARSKAVEALTVQVQRFSATYAKNVAPAARKSWKEAVERMAGGRISVYKTFTQREGGTHTVYVMMILDPVDFKKALSDAISINQEFARKAKKDIILKKMDAIIADFDSKYRKK